MYGWVCTSLLGENSSSRLHSVEEAMTRTSSGAFCNSYIQQQHTNLLIMCLSIFTFTHIQRAIVSKYNFFPYTHVQRCALLYALTKTRFLKTQLTFMRGFHTAWSWKLVLSCCTDRERLWRHLDKVTSKQTHKHKFLHSCMIPSRKLTS